MSHQTFFKEPRSRKVERFKKRLTRTRIEDAEKKAVRLRDKHCRFPFCGCRKIGLQLHVSHKVHRGMGGNPAGDRTTQASMVLVCSARHRENRISIDRGTLKWEASTKKGANGPISWWVDAAEAIGGDWTGATLRSGETQWVLLARERDLHQYDGDSLQAQALHELAKMEM